MIRPTKSFAPNIDDTCYIADESCVIGDVILKEKANIWPCAVLRGDINTIEIGKFSNVQDGVVIHVTKKLKTIVGDYVSIGHGAKLHGCKIGDRVLIGIGAIVLDGAEIGDGAVVAAGTVVPPGKKVPPNMLAVGNPFKVLREVREDEHEYNMAATMRYAEEYPPEQRF
jgi:carbonic anhydrase/acetyltransferase-like protein (isoleucine patch superfamily)